jgi:uncharacterized protein (TIGR02246 family)
MHKSCLFALLCLLLFGIALPVNASSVDGDRAAIEAQINQWLDGYNTANIDKINNVFSPDLVFMTSGAAGTLDRATLARAYQAQFTKYRCHIVGITDEIRISGDMAYDRGHFTITLTPKAGGAEIRTAGSFLETWSKGTDGTWRVTRLANIEAQ